MRPFINCALQQRDLLAMGTTVRKVFTTDVGST